MKISLLRWLFTALILSTTMAIVFLIITMAKYLIGYINDGLFSTDLLEVIFLSVKLGVFVGFLITFGLWIKYRFNP